MSQVQRFNTQKGPKAIGPYSTASIYRGVAYISGQIGISPETGELVGPDIESQAKRAMDNIQIILDELKIPFADVIKATVFLKVNTLRFRICLTLQKLMQFMEATSHLNLILQG